jgi:acyl-CoA synthetase (AMP-forming)/AMP-acid ligase II
VGEATLVDVLRKWADRRPEQLAFGFASYSLGERAIERMYYGELDRRARGIAAALQGRVRRGDRALLMYLPGLEFVSAYFGCLYAGVIAVPVYPSDPLRIDVGLNRIEAIATNAGPSIGLSHSRCEPLLRLLRNRSAALGGLPWLDTDGDLDEQGWLDPGVGEEDLAFLQYTSGSTSAPKGVALRHGSLIANLVAIRSRGQHTDKKIGASWIPFYHDMGLIGGVLANVHGGSISYMMSPVDFLQRPIRWLELISDLQANVTGAPNFGYETCVRRIDSAECEGLDLRSLEIAGNGSEPVSAATLDRFTEKFSPYGFRAEAFRPCYGLAEATLMVAGGQVHAGVVVRRGPASRGPAAWDAEAAARRMVGCGFVADGHEIEIVDPVSRKRVLDGVEGEIWFRGPSVADGYWNQPEATAATFDAEFLDSGERGYLRTGDVGMVENGELFVTGRLKEILVIRGRKHSPIDLEETARDAHPMLGGGAGAAFCIDGGLGEVVAIVHECVGASGLDAVIREIRRRVTERHQIRLGAVVLIQVRTLPRTSSGKVRRSECRRMFLGGELNARAEWRDPGLERGRSEGVEIGA